MSVGPRQGKHAHGMLNPMGGDGRRPMNLLEATMNAALDLVAVAVLFAQGARAA
ncbi:hypothetical protein CYFUS_007193 [Cystobacter fuscus]|uniref:Uncharacterized protein n=1 Tax=Cystobacter fuscus TaxID=43 RepID=A0A250JDL9_9BACT|nr:hypothetical protein CYFUS_007193 [Cystobacter fuscus]